MEEFDMNKFLQNRIESAEVDLDVGKEAKKKLRNKKKNVQSMND